jgi:ADP-ribose pyrophosphatase
VFPPTTYHLSHIICKTAHLLKSSHPMRATLLLGESMTQNLEKFLLSERKEVFGCRIFKVFEQQAKTPDSMHETNIYTLGCSHWVNIVPITATGQVVLVEQHRFGTDTFSLETPGGAIDPGEKDATMAAIRELEEETGLTSQRILSLPGFAANPAIQSNRVTFFVAFDVQPLTKPSTHTDPFEQIKIHLIDFKEALEMVRVGRINHSLAALALLLAEPFVQTKFGARMP